MKAATATFAVVVTSLGFIGRAQQGEYQDLPRVSAATPFSADCNGPNFPITAAYVNAESEPFLAVNPRNPKNLIAVYHEDRFWNDGANGVLASTSFDGGLTWQIPELKNQPAFSRCAGGTEANGGDFEKSSDPVVAFGPDGTAYFAAVAWNASNPEAAQFISTSHDGGRTWERPVAVHRAKDPDVRNTSRPTVAPDPTRQHTAYVVWDRQRVAPADDARGGTAFSRSMDSGKTWSEARVIYEAPLGMHTSANRIQVMPNGDLVNLFSIVPMKAASKQLTQLTQTTHLVVVIRSADGGVTWSQPVTVATAEAVNVVDPRTGAVVRTGEDFNDFVVDRRPGTNTAYAAWEDARFTQGRTSQIAFVKSTDGGRTWSEPVAALSDPATQQFIPSLAVNDHGGVAAAWYDFPIAKSSTPELLTRYWIAFSSDQGRSWTAKQPVTSHPFDLRAAPYNTGFFFGEYQGLVGAGASFVSAMTLANGHSLENRTDIYSCTVNPDDHLVSRAKAGTVCAAPGLPRRGNR